MNSPVKPPSQFYLYKKLDLIPLHCPADLGAPTKAHPEGEPLGKLPLEFNWAALPPKKSEQVIARCIAEGRNMGFRPDAQVLIIDVDPRNSGDKSFERLMYDAGIIPSKYPTTITGSEPGGRHYYGLKPPGLRVRKSLKDFPGIEFISRGGQVLCAGSIHPKTGKPYRHDPKSPAYTAMPAWPSALLDIIARKDAEVSASGPGGEMTVDQLAVALAKLDAKGFRDHDEWLQIMMAAHSATAGEGVETFTDWSTSDPNYEDQGEQIRLRWDSLDYNQPDGVTFRTLNKILREHGAIDEQAPPSNAAVNADFAGDPLDPADMLTAQDFEGDDESQGEGTDNEWLVELNEKYCAVTTGGKYRITYQGRSPTGAVWESMGKTDFISFHENRTIQQGDKDISLGVAWQRWPKRRTATGTIFDATIDPGVLDANGNLNLWLGWAIEPKKGDWSKFEAMIHDDICDGKDSLAKYVLDWTAWKFQNPDDLPGVSIAMRGGKGTGKGTLGDTIVYCFGTHAMATSQMDQIGGRFNGHLESKLFVYADEAFWAGDPRQESTIKKLISDRPTTYEYKGVTSFPGVNRVALMFGTNNEWVVPASEDERRYCVLATSSKHQCPQGEPDHPNRPYWDAIYAELNNGGRAAFLHAMLTRQLPKGWHPRNNVPMTQELANQKARSLTGVAAFYYDRLQSGELYETVTGFGHDNWARGEMRVSPTDFWKSCQSYIQSANPHATVSRRALGLELKRYGWDVGEHLRQAGGSRDRYWLCPSLPKARARFEAIMKGKLFE